MADELTAERDNRSDAELTAAYRNGEEGAAAELYRRYYLKLLRGVATKLPSFEIAEDCVGEAFLSVLEIIQRGSGPTSNFYGYLRSAVVRESARYFREREVGPSLDEISEDGGGQPAFDDDLSHIDESLLAPALRSLPDRWRELVALRYVERLKPAQIAALLGTEAPALHKMLYRAKKGLRDEYLKQVALTRSNKSCREYADELTALAITDLDPEPGSSLEVHLLGCCECQATLEELKHQSHRVRPEALGLGLLVGGIIAGSTIVVGGGSEASALSEPSASGAASAGAGESASQSATTLSTLSSTGKIASVGGVFQTLGTAGTLIIGGLLAGSLAGAGLLYAAEVSQPSQPEVSPPSAGKIDKDGERTQKKVVRTDDGDCELNITVADGTLIVDASVHAGKCWFTYHRVGDEPREEQLLSTGWMIVTRLAGDYEFELRSKTSTKSDSISL